MGYTAGEAHRHSGLAKSTITRAVERGELRGEKQADGSLDIDVEEFHRWLSRRKTQPGAKPVAQLSETPNETGETPGATPSENSEIALLKKEVEHLGARLKDKEDVIDDLRARLDREEEERRAVTRQLTDMRERESETGNVLRQVTALAEQIQAERKRSWWSRLRGRE